MKVNRSRLNRLNHVNHNKRDKWQEAQVQDPRQNAETLCRLEKYTDCGPDLADDYFWNVSDYKKLLVWEKSHKLAVDGIKAAVRIRPAHFASIKSQMIRAAGSIPMNIVEGSGQESRKDFCRFLRYSLNSAYELEYQWLLAKDIEILSEEDFNKLAPATVEVQKMLRGLLRRLRPPDDRENHPPPPSN